VPVVTFDELANSRIYDVAVNSGTNRVAVNGVDVIKVQSVDVKFEKNTATGMHSVLKNSQIVMEYKPVVGSNPFYNANAQCAQNGAQCNYRNGVVSITAAGPVNNVPTVKFERLKDRLFTIQNFNYEADVLKVIKGTVVFSASNEYGNSQGIANVISATCPSTVSLLNANETSELLPGTRSPHQLVPAVISQTACQ
jgi:hypothetical protein